MGGKGIMGKVKFRVWDVQRKVLANVTSIMWLSEDEIEIDHDKNGLREPFQIHADTAILEQFTGKQVWQPLDDLEGKVDLYEGDIMKRKDELFVIVFFNGAFVGRSLKNEHKYLSLTLLTDNTSSGIAGKLVGNIHDKEEVR